jgi:TPR repeat protein
LTVYALRDLAEPLVTEILKVQQREGDSKVVRLKLMITPKSFDDGGSFSENAELIDWQFITSDRSGWGAWANEQIAVDRATAAKEQIAAAQKLAAERAAAANKAAKAAQERALKYNQDQADKGDPTGLLRMGERYRDGDGVPKDLSKAREYFTKAVNAGSPTAADALSKLNQVSTNSPATR